MIADAIDLGSKRIDLFFMIGLPKQTYPSVLETVDYCRSLLERFRSYSQTHPFHLSPRPLLRPRECRIRRHRKDMVIVFSTEPWRNTAKL